MANQDFLSRWSRRKQADEDLRAAENQEDAPKPLVDNLLQNDTLKSHAQQGSSGSTLEEARPEGVIELPSLESLTPQSDFKPFMQSGIASATRNAALKKLFTDPHFNVMDGLDTYIDDYTKSEPMPAEWLKSMWQSRGTLFSPEERVAADEEDARLAAAARELALAEEHAKMAAPTESPQTSPTPPAPPNFATRIAHDNSR